MSFKDEKYIFNFSLCTLVCVTENMLYAGDAVLVQAGAPKEEFTAQVNNDYIVFWSATTVFPKWQSQIHGCIQ